jgi:hypothetical protein
MTKSLKRVKNRWPVKKRTCPNKKGRDILRE